ncbi:MAG: hypothetical protein LAO22_13480 [Acidobacteriia bacterium]|nr:hypothetical protein [Terriglobia bacterium]
MRRALTIGAFVLLVAVVSASAQRGGMRASGGGHGIGVGHPSGGHAFSGRHGGPRARPSFRGDGFGGVHFRAGGFHHCHGCRSRFWSPWGYAGYGYGAYYPFWWGDTSSSYNFDEEREQEILLANQMNALSIQEQNLREREDWLREREEQDSYARRLPVREEEHSAPSPATVLVFRDQHQQEVRNYAIAGGTLWVFSEQAAKKVPLSELDLAATTKANNERGVEFQVPK